MRGHACKGQLPAMEETKRSSAIMPSRDHCCLPQCQNNRAKKYFKSRLSPISERWIHSKAVDCQSTARRGQKFPGKLVELSRHCAHVLYDLLHLQMTNSTRACSVHFKEADLKTTLTGKRALEKYAVPSMFCWSRSPRKKKSPKKGEPPRARVRLFDRSVPSSPATDTGKYCCPHFFEHSLVKIVK